VLSLRHEGSSLGAHARAAAQPERVLAYSKRVDVRWGRVNARLRGVVALSDVMRFDLTPLRRRMQPAIEAHARLNRGSGSGSGSGSSDIDTSRRLPCEAVACARVYHVNVVLRVRAAAPTGNSILPPSGGAKDQGEGKEKRSNDNDSAAAAAAAAKAAKALPPAGTMVLERARVVMDQSGIVRLEPAGRSRLAVKPARAAGVVAAGLAATWGGNNNNNNNNNSANNSNNAAAAAVVPRGSQPPALSTEHAAAAAADPGGGRLKGALGQLWKNSAGKLVASRKRREEGEGEEGREEGAAAGSVIVVGERSDEGQERDDDDDDDPEMFPVGDEAV